MGRSRLDFAAINATLTPEILIPAWLPDGRKAGNEWIARNPTRLDDRPGSFSINLRSGAWSDFATGDRGGDLVSLYAYLFHNKDQGAAARALAESNGVRLDQAGQTPAQLAILEDAKRQRLAERDAKRKAATSRASTQWAGARPVSAHAYLETKAVPSHGLRSDRWGNLLIPLHDAATGEFLSVQRIDAIGSKRFAKGAPTGGACFTIPGIKPRIFCEGYATGATLHSATGREIVVAFNAGNIPAVAAVLADAGDIIAADNDETGAGEKAAAKAALPYVMPPNLGDDWNDHAAKYGLASVTDFFGLTVASDGGLRAVDVWAIDATDLSDTPQAGLLAALSKVTSSEDAASHALAVARRLSTTAPIKHSVDDICDAIGAAVPEGLLHPDTLSGIGKRLKIAMRHRHAAALAPVTIPAEMKQRHAHEPCLRLPTLSAGDYRGVIVVRAPMASGKTRTIGRPFIAWAKREGLIPLAICHRVSLVSDMAKALDLTGYADADENDARIIEQQGLSRAGGLNAAPTDGLAICLPSITSATFAPVIRSAAVLFIDEISQVLRFLAAGNHCRTKHANSQAVYERLCDLVTEAQCVIVADAGCDARTIAFLEHCRPGEQFRIIEMADRAEGIQASYTYGKKAPAAVVAECMVELAAGGRVWIAVESKRRAAQLGRIFADHGARAMAIHADNKGNAAQSAFLADPEAESRRYDVVIASPVIGSGLSIEHQRQPHFTMGAYIGGGHAVTAADAAQALRRVRYLRRYVLGILPNSETGQQSAHGLVRGWADAADMEGAPALPDTFTEVVAGIRASDANARADFAAALFWQLEAAKWSLDRWNADADETDAELKQAKADHEEQHRRALTAAEPLSDTEAKSLRNKPARTDTESIALEAYRARQELGISSYEAITSEALDVWDNGAGPTRLDRFSAFRWGLAARSNDTAENAANRRYQVAMAKAYATIFDGFDIVSLRMTKADADTVLDRVIENRFLLSALGIVPKKFAAWLEDKEGNLLGIKRPANAQREVGEICRRMGLSRKVIDGRATPKTPISALEINEHSGGTGKSGARDYRIALDSLEMMEAWAERRNRRRRPIAATERTHRTHLTSARAAASTAHTSRERTRFTRTPALPEYSHAHSWRWKDASASAYKAAKIGGRT